jgi:hypothetical protein
MPAPAANAPVRLNEDVRLQADRVQDIKALPWKTIKARLATELDRESTSGVFTVFLLNLFA